LLSKFLSKNLNGRWLLEDVNLDEKVGSTKTNFLRNFMIEFIWLRISTEAGFLRTVKKVAIP
jgi:hypothetical protein